jgi:hypothetical protein
MFTSSPHHADRFLLWIDAVGGYWVCLGDEVVFGQPVGAAEVDVPMLGDLSAQHARIRRDGEGYLIEAIRDVRVDGRSVEQATTLIDGNVIQLGHCVKLVFRRPHALSATVRLDFASRHRTQPSSDAIILMADSCVLGPKPQSHIVCRKWKDDVILYRQDKRLYCRTPGEFQIDGRPQHGQGPLARNSHVAGSRFALCLEEV